MDGVPATFEEFWPEYVKAHSNKLNRTLHVVGTSLALACVVAAVLKRRPSLLLLAAVLGYGFAWCGHFFVEKNMPATFSHPLFSLRADALLVWKTVCGEMDAEVKRIQDEAEHPETPREATTTAEVN
jgi:hypothetical protein